MNITVVTKYATFCPERADCSAVHGCHHTCHLKEVARQSQNKFEEKGFEFHEAAAYSELSLSTRVQ